jgi:hypothetical protein
VAAVDRELSALPVEMPKLPEVDSARLAKALIQRLYRFERSSFEEQRKRLHQFCGDSSWPMVPFRLSPSRVVF